MQRESPYERAKTLCLNQAVPPGILYFYIFLFDQKDLDSRQRQKILEFQTDAISHVVPLATTIQQYCQIQEKVLKGEHPRQAPKIILVTNLTFCEEIIWIKKSKDSLAELEEVYLCYKQESEPIMQLINKYEIINKQVHNLNDVIDLSGKHFKNLREKQGILKNFIVISEKKCKRRSYLVKVRAKGCIMLRQEQYEEYKQKFNRHLLRKSTIGNGENVKQFSTVINGLQFVLKLLKQQKLEEFSQEMLNLYQGSVFHAILNNGLMEFTNQHFDWAQLALPFSLLYKAIKIKFYLLCLSEEQIQKIFDNSEQIILWRGGRISQIELNELRQSRQKRPFYELSSFCSTSLKKEIATGFLNPKKPHQNCLMKIKLKKPTTRQEIERFSFIYQSFAAMKNQSQHQILLNALTIVRLSSSKYNITSCKQSIRETKVQTWVIQLQVVDIESVIERYLKKDPSLTEYENQATRHYLMTIDSIKDDDAWDIGDSLRFSGQLIPAKGYYTQKLMQLENSQNSTQQEQIKNKRSQHQICEKLSDICLSLNLEKQSITYSQLSIKTYQFVEKIDKSIKFDEHQQYITRKLEKYTFILQIYGHVQEAQKAIEDRIKLYEKDIIQKKDLRIACQFFTARLLINLGVIWLRQGKYREAKIQFDKSQQKVQSILKQIDYHDIQSQTFPLRFIIDKIFKVMELSWQQYNKKKRDDKIDQLTRIFGGKKRLQEILQTSEGLKKKVIDCFKDKRSQAPDSLKKTKKQSNQKLVKKQFVDNLSRQSNPQDRQFINGLKKDIKNDGQPEQFKKYRHIYGLIIDAAEQNIQDIDKYNDQLNNCKQELIFDRLTEWKSKDLIQRESALQTKKNLERHILKLRQTQEANLFKYKVQNRKHYQQYLKSSINFIAEHLKDMRDYDCYHPTLETINYRFRRQELIQRQGDEIQAEAQIQRIIQDAKSNPNFMIQTLQAYLLSAKLYYSITDIDFLNCLEKKVQPRKKLLQIEKMQRQFIQKCNQKIQQAAKLVQKSYKNGRQKLMIDSQESTEAIVQSRLKITKQLQDRHKQKVKRQKERMQEIDVHLHILRAKCLIFGYNNQMQYHQRLENQLIIQRAIKNIQKKMDLFNKDCQGTIFRPYFNQMMALYKFKCNELKQGLIYFNKSFTKLPQYREIQRNFYIMSKIIFMYSRHCFSLGNHVNQLQKSQKITVNYPFYWRICLAMHVQYKKTKQNSLLLIRKCLESIQKLQQQQKYNRHKDQNFQLKYKIIEKFEYQPMKQKYQANFLKNSIETLDTKAEISHSRVFPIKKNFNLKTSRSIKSLKSINSQIYKSQLLDLKLLNVYSQQSSIIKTNNAVKLYQSQIPIQNKQVVSKQTIRIYSARHRREVSNSDQEVKGAQRVRLKQRKQRYLIYSEQKHKRKMAIEDISIKLI